jgi:Ca2+-binding EF-hand superfamily protein
MHDSSVFKEIFNDLDKDRSGFLEKSEIKKLV